MTYTSTVTQKGQVTLPKSLRKKFGIKVREKVTIQADKNHIKIVPAIDILGMAGSLGKTLKNPKSVLSAREELERNYTRV